jgi:SRSO17 transposase
MTQELSDKKKFAEKSYLTDNKQLNLITHVGKYGKRFVVHRRDSHQMAFSYLSNLLRCEKSHTNMERMVEQDIDNETEYHQYYHFLSESKWDFQSVNECTMLQTSDLMEQIKLKNNKPTGLIIDESSHLKKGDESVGVARQYAGVAGKVDNCQVAVYCTLTNDENVTLIDTTLFLPQKWIDDKVRCDKAHIPEDKVVFKTKPQLALEMIKTKVALGVKFDWIGGDGLYGHNSELTRGLDEESLFYVLDIHKDETFFLQEPSFSIPKKSKTKGRTPTKIKPNIDAIRVDKYNNELKVNDFEQVIVRKTAKGLKHVMVHIVAVWHWDGLEEKAKARTLVITKTLGKNPKIKFSFSNGKIEEYTNQEYAYFQSGRYWVERSLDDAKNELGLSGYQVRGWLAWHHHQALVMMASLYLMKIKLEEKPNYELMSVRDARIMIIAHIYADQKTITLLHNQMLKRHKDRKRDIDRYYKNEDS